MRKLIGFFVLFAVMVGSKEVRAVDFEAKLKYDKVCKVEAMNSEGDVYLKCKGEAAILKTSVELPSVSSANSLDLKTAAQAEIRLARVRLVWAMLNFSFSSDANILLDFNSDKTLIRRATVYNGANSRKTTADKKLDL